MRKLIGNLDEGKLIIISAPAGTGKTTLACKLVEEFPQHVVRSVSCTTRLPREGEAHGKDYFFLAEKEFEEYKIANQFLEYATVFKAQYGTLKELVVRQCADGKHVILVIDTQGAMKLRYRNDAIFVFIKPPSLVSLKERLAKRNTESSVVIQQRLDRVDFEMDQAKYYDYHIVNKDLEQAYQVLKSIVIAEEHKNRGKR